MLGCIAVAVFLLLGQAEEASTEKVLVQIDQGPVFVHSGPSTASSVTHKVSFGIVVTEPSAPGWFMLHDGSGHVFLMEENVLGEDVWATLKARMDAWIEANPEAVERALREAAKPRISTTLRRKVTEKNSTFWRVSWVATMHNPLPHPVKVTFDVKFLDGDGFELDSDRESLIQLEPGDNTLTGAALVEPALARRIESDALVLIGAYE